MPHFVLSLSCLLIILGTKQELDLCRKHVFASLQVVVRTTGVDEIKQMSENRAKDGDQGHTERAVMMKETEKERPEGQEGGGVTAKEKVGNNVRCY